VGLLDRIIDGGIGIAEKLSPEWALKREHARARREILNQGYSQHGASRLKKSMAGWVTARGGPDADITLNLDLLRQRSRDLCMGDPLAIGALKTIQVNEIGSGLRLNAQVDAEYLGLDDDEALEWEAHTEREFSLWANSTACDAHRRCTFGELEALVRLSELMSGDVFVMLPSIEREGDRYDLKVKLLEADRVSDPWPYPVGHNVLGGVELDESGAPIFYYMTKIHPGDLFLPGTYGGYGAFAYGAVSVPPLLEGGIYGAQWNTWEKIPAFGATGRRLVLHIMELERPGQRRGVPILAPVMEHLKQLSRYSQAELMAAVVSGMFTAAITSERPSAMPGQIIPPGSQVVDTDPTTYQLGNGALLGLLPGEKLEAVNPSRPNAGFEPFVRAVSQQVGAALGIPYELLVMQFTSSYSASRGALLEAWKRFFVGRHRVATRFCQPIYEQWLEEAVARGYVEAPGFFADPVTRAAWCGAEWVGPSQGQLDPVKEVEAAEKRVASGFSTRTQETAALTGGNFERNHRVRVREEKLRREGQVVMAPTSTSPDEPAPAPAADGGEGASPTKEEAA
jgi:capsid protein